MSTGKIKRTKNVERYLTPQQRKKFESLSKTLKEFAAKAFQISPDLVDVSLECDEERETVGVA